MINICMRLHEFSNPLKTYLATVRVAMHGSSSIVRTTITADCASDAVKLLAAIVGMRNVLNVSQIVSEAPQIDQIQLERAIRPLVVRRRAKPRKVAQIQSSQVQRQRKLPKSRQISTKPIAAPIKHKFIQDKLTQQFVRQSNVVKPTRDDIRIAQNRAQTELKRADLDFKKRTDAEQRKQERQRPTKQ